MNIKVGIVEDDDDIRRTLELIVKGTPGLECVCVCENGNVAVESVPKSNCDVVLMDINMPGISGIDCVRILKEKSPKTQFMMCTVYEEDEKIFSALRAGASGYIIKKTPPAQLLEAIREIYEGGAPMSPAIARRVVQAFKPGKSELSDETISLTEREKEILILLSKGFRYKEIAGQLSISLDTVKRHAHNIYEKMHVQSRTDAINKAFRH